MLFFFTFYIINSHFITCTNILIILILKSKIFTTQSHITRFTGAAFVGCNFKKISIIKEKAKYSHFNHTLITGFHRPLRLVPPTMAASPQLIRKLFSFKFMYKKKQNIHTLITLYSHFNHRIPPASAGCTPYNDGLASTSTVLQCTHAILSIALFSRKIAPLLAILPTTYSR